MEYSIKKKLFTEKFNEQNLKRFTLLRFTSLTYLYLEIKYLNAVNNENQYANVIIHNFTVIFPVFAKVSSDSTLMNNTLTS